MSEDSHEAVEFGLLEGFLRRGIDDWNFLLQFGDAVCSEGIKFDQNGFDRCIIGISKSCAELVANVLGESLCLRDFGEELLLEGIDDRDRSDFGNEFGMVSRVAVDLRCFCLRGGHRASIESAVKR